MEKMNINELRKEINNKKIEPLYLIKGNEEILNDKVREIFKTVIDPQDIAMNFNSFDMKESSIDDLVVEAISTPFFGDRRLIYVENPYFLTGEKNGTNIEQDTEKLINYIQNPMETSTVVIFANYEKLDSRKKVVKELNKLASIVDTSKISPNQIDGYVKGIIQKSGYEITDKALNLLVQKTKADFSEINNNLEKLYLYCLDTKIIDDTAVDSLVPNTLEDNVFNLINAILNKNTSLAEDLYRQMLLQKVEPIALNALVISQLRLLIQISILESQGLGQTVIAKNLKIHPYRVKMATAQVKKYSFSKLKEMYQSIVNTDFKMKTGQDSKEMLFELYIARFA